MILVLNKIPTTRQGNGKGNDHIYSLLAYHAMMVKVIEMMLKGGGYHVKTNCMANSLHTFLTCSQAVNESKLAIINDPNIVW